MYQESPSLQALSQNSTVEPCVNLSKLSTHNFFEYFDTDDSESSFLDSQSPSLINSTSPSAGGWNSRSTYRQPCRTALRNSFNIMAAIAFGNNFNKFINPEEDTISPLLRSPVERETSKCSKNDQIIAYQNQIYCASPLIPCKRESMDYVQPIATGSSQKSNHYQKFSSSLPSFDKSVFPRRPSTLNIVPYSMTSEQPTSVSPTTAAGGVPSSPSYNIVVQQTAMKSTIVMISGSATTMNYSQNQVFQSQNPATTSFSSSSQSTSSSNGQRFDSSYFNKNPQPFLQTPAQLAVSSSNLSSSSPQLPRFSSYTTISSSGMSTVSYHNRNNGYMPGYTWSSQNFEADTASRQSVSISAAEHKVSDLKHFFMQKMS